MAASSVAELHRYPLRPKGHQEPLFPTSSSKRAVVEHLLKAPWLHRASDLKGYAEYTGETARVREEHVKIEKAISSIILERTKRPFPSVADLYRRTSVEKDTLENLIKGGFLDALTGSGENRLRLLDDTRRLPKKPKSNHQPEIPLAHPASWWASREGRTVYHLPLTETNREKMEWETLELNVYRHPLSPYREALENLGVIPSKEIRKLPHNTRVRVAGLIESLQRPPTKSGVPVYFLLIEDEWGLLQATIFRRVYERYGHILHHTGALLLEGRVEQDRKRGFSFLVERIEDLRKVLSGARVPSPKTTSGSGALIRVGRDKRRAG